MSPVQDAKTSLSFSATNNIQILKYKLPLCDNQRQKGYLGSHIWSKGMWLEQPQGQQSSFSLIANQIQGNKERHSNTHFLYILFPLCFFPCYSHGKVKTVSRRKLNPVCFSDKVKFYHNKLFLVWFSVHLLLQSAFHLQLDCGKLTLSDDSCHYHELKIKIIFPSLSLER